MKRASEELRQALRQIEAMINSAASYLDPNAAEDGGAIRDLDQMFTTVSHWRRELEAGRWPGRRVTSFPPGWENEQRER